VIVLGAFTLGVLIFKRKDFTLFAFDPIHARAIGLNPKIIGAVLLALLALTSVVALQAVGVILVVAMLIIPGATAYLLTDQFSKMLIIAPVLGAIAAIAGVYLSYYLDTASGGMVVLSQGAMFALVYLFSPRQGVIGKRIRAASYARLQRRSPQAHFS
jgi:manganese transport system permease protein